MELSEVRGERRAIGFSVKRAIGFALKVMAIAAAILTALVVVGGLTVPEATTEAAPAEGAAMMLPMVAVGVVDALILAFIVTQSRWRGLPLIAGLALALYGAQTLLGQIEALAFLTPLGERFGAGSIPTLTLPVEQITSSLIVGAARAAVGVPLAVLLFGKAKGDGERARISLGQGMGAGQWVVKLGAIILLYELLYFGFGYYVAWKNPAVLAFYRGTDPGSFVAQMRNVISGTPTLLGLQAVRALLWAAFALPVIDMLEDKPWIGALATGLLLSIPANAQHIIPNPYMPAAVRAAHFVETASSTFIFGALLFGLLYRSHRSLADLFGLSDGDEGG